MMRSLSLPNLSPDERMHGMQQQQEDWCRLEPQVGTGGLSPRLQLQLLPQYWNPQEQGGSPLQRGNSPPFWKKGRGFKQNPFRSVTNSADSLNTASLNDSIDSNFSVAAVQFGQHSAGKFYPTNSVFDECNNKDSLR